MRTSEKIRRIKPKNVTVIIIIIIVIIGIVNLTSLVNYYSTKGDKEVAKKTQAEILIERNKAYKDNLKLDTLNFIFRCKPELDPGVAKIIAVAVNKYSKQFNHDPALIVAIIARESSWNILAASSCGCAGLMQYHYEIHKTEDTERDLNKINIYHIDNNIYLGCKDLRRKLDRHNGNLKQALRSYSGGVTKTKKQYINDILTKYKELKIMKNSRRKL